MGRLGLAVEEFVVVDDPDLPEPVAPPISQTRSLGRKQSAVCWLPTMLQTMSVAVAGSWDDPVNELALWGWDSSPMMEADPMQDADGDVELPKMAAPKMLCSVEHAGDVLDLSVAGGSGAPILIFCASGSGGVSCFGADSADGGGSVALQRKWQPADSAGCPTLGVSWSATARQLAAVTEGGTEGGAPRGGSLLLLEPESGREIARAACEEASGLSWQGPSRPDESHHSILTAASSVLCWDSRCLERGPSLSLSPLDPRAGENTRATPHLHCLSVHPQQPQLVAAGSSDGRLFLWDVRYPSSPLPLFAATSPQVLPSASQLEAHGADIWAIQFSEMIYGHLLSCSSDGTLQARRLSSHPFAGGWTCPEESVTTLVGLDSGLPINSLDVSDECGCLVAASDAEVLTFIDVRR